MPITFIKSPIRFNGDKSTPTHCRGRTIGESIVSIVDGAVVDDGWRFYIVLGHVPTLLVILHAADDGRLSAQSACLL